MRDLLNQSLESLIWTATVFFVLSSCFSGYQIISTDPSESGLLIGGILVIIFGVTMAFVFAGICFQIMDIRAFTKHTAIGLKKMNGR